MEDEKSHSPTCTCSSEFLLAKACRVRDIGWKLEGLTGRKGTAAQGLVVANLCSVHGPLYIQTELFEDSISVAVIRLDR